MCLFWPHWFPNLGGQSLQYSQVFYCPRGLGPTAFQESRIPREEARGFWTAPSQCKQRDCRLAKRVLSVVPALSTLAFIQKRPLQMGANTGLVFAQAQKISGVDGGLLTVKGSPTARFFGWHDQCPLLFVPRPPLLEKPLVHCGELAGPACRRSAISLLTILFGLYSWGSEVGHWIVSQFPGSWLQSNIFLWFDSHAQGRGW